MLEPRSVREDVCERTHSMPVETMSDSILGSVRLWSYLFVDVLDFCITATTTPFRGAVIDMYVPTHRRANKITQHRSSFVIRREFAAPQLESCSVWPVNYPAGLGHGSMASFVFFLRVT